MVDSAFGGKSEVRDEAQAKELEWEIEDGSTATANREEKTRGLRSDPTQVWSRNLFFTSLFIFTSREAAGQVEV